LEAVSNNICLHTKHHLICENKKPKAKGKGLSVIIIVWDNKAAVV